MKVIQIVPDIYEESAGPSYSVPASARGLLHNGVDVKLFSVGKMPEWNHFEYPVLVFPRAEFPLRALARSPQMFRALKEEAQTADILHTNSIWQMPNVYPDWARRGTKCKFVIGPRGTVSKWAMQRGIWKKLIFGTLFQYPAMRRADMFVASCQEEADDIRRLGFVQPIAIVGNGIDVPASVPYGKASRRRMYFLSRIHPKKNVELLIRCWSKLEKEFPDWDLSIVGRDVGNDYADEMKRLSKALRCQRITFEGEIRGREKERFMAESECMVLPTHSENFGMVVAESLAWGTPVICSQGAPWAGLTANGCGWWVPAAEATFMEAMQEAMTKDRKALAEMGQNGRDWMLCEFTWDRIGAQLKAAYAWLLGQSDRPSFVQCAR